MLLETKRMRIRDYLPEDAADLYEILGDAEVMKGCEPAYSLAKTVQFLSEFCIGKRGAVAAVHKDSGRMIGYILFHELEEGCYEIGWFFNKSFWRRGYAYESCEAVMRYAFRELGAYRIFAETTDGLRSAGLMKKLGMRLEGAQQICVEAGDTVAVPVRLDCYGLSREEWMARQKTAGTP